VQGKETTGLSYNTSSVRVRTKISALSDDAAKVKQWLTTQPDPMTQFKKYSYEEMKSALMSHLNPEEDLKENVDSVEVKTETVGDLPWEKEETPTQETPTPKFSLSTKKTDVDAKIDELFSF